jgi:hypothetical protein
MAKNLYEEIVGLHSKGMPASQATMIARTEATSRKDACKIYRHAAKLKK